jgi:tetratricopeptide (TPR) repeat protein
MDDPNDFDSWNEKGNVYYKLKKYDEAIKCYDKAIEIDPNFTHAWNNNNSIYSIILDKWCAYAYSKNRS